MFRKHFHYSKTKNRYVVQLLMNSFMRKNYSVNLFACKNAFIVRKCNISDLPLVPPTVYNMPITKVSACPLFCLHFLLFHISFLLCCLYHFHFLFVIFYSRFLRYFSLSLFSSFLSGSPHSFSLTLLVISFCLLLLILASCLCFCPFLLLPSSAFLFPQSCHVTNKDACEPKQYLQTIIDRTVPNCVAAFGT